MNKLVEVLILCIILYGFYLVVDKVQITSLEKKANVIDSKIDSLTYLENYHYVNLRDSIKKSMEENIRNFDRVNRNIDSLKEGQVLIYDEVTDKRTVKKNSWLW